MSTVDFEQVPLDKRSLKHLMTESQRELHSTVDVFHLYVWETWLVHVPPHKGSLKHLMSES